MNTTSLVNKAQDKSKSSQKTSPNQSYHGRNKNLGNRKLNLQQSYSEGWFQQLRGYK